jgi:hypothetical protein
MTGRIATKAKRRHTTMVPVTTMEEIPVLADAERAALTADLRKAESRIKAGKGVDYESRTFSNRLIGIYRGAKR